MTAVAGPARASRFWDFVVPILGRPLRIFRRRPALATTILAVLSIGIGATTAAFGFVAVAERPLPFPEPEQLTMLWQSQPQVPQGPLSIADFFAWRDNATSFQAIAAVYGHTVNLRIGSAPPGAVRAGVVSGEFFDVLRVTPAHGRVLTRDDDRADADRVVVVSAELERAGAAMGSTLTIDGASFRVAGTMPPSFDAAPPTGRVAVWIPLAIARSGVEAEANRTSDESRFLYVIGRRKPGVSVAAAEAQMGEVARRIGAQYPEHNGGFGVRFLDLRDSLVQPWEQSFGLSFLATAFVFLIACANVANLLLVDAAARRTEMAIRIALGATRGRLVLQVLGEIWLLFLLAAAAGTALAFGITHVVRIRMSGGNLSLLRFGIDGGVLAFTTGLASLSGLAVGLWPALEATRVAPGAVLKEAESRAPLGRTQRRLRSAFVVLEVALAFALLAATDYSFRTYQHNTRIGPGFDPFGVISARTSLPTPKYGTPEARRAFYDAVLARLAATPGVEHAAITSSLPCDGDYSNSTFDVEGRPPYAPNAGPLIFHHFVSKDYLATMRIELLSGRGFRADEVAADRAPALINAEAARSYFRGEDPIGKRITFDNVKSPKRRWLSIVGVVANIRQLGLGEGDAPEIYLPMEAAPSPAMSFVVRGPAAAIAPAVHAVDPEIAVALLRPMPDVVSRSIGSQRSFLEILLAVAATALLLATLGVLGVVGYTTSLRTRELGVRMALGATPGNVVRLVLRDGMRLVALGLLLGLGFAVVLGRMLWHRGYIPTPFDASGLAVVALVLAIAGAVASLGPALRGARVAPAIALRDEGAR